MYTQMVWDAVAYESPAVVDISCGGGCNAVPSIDMLVFDRRDLEGEEGLKLQVY